MGKTDNLSDVLALLWSKRIFFIKVGAAVGLISAIISLTLPNYYRATTTFYAASPDLSKPERIFGYSSYDMNYYGSGLDVDRLMTIGFSNEVAEFLIDSFTLYDHYDIDSLQEMAQFKIKTKLSSLYDLVKTKFDAIELSIEDRDRYVASKMANAARVQINELAQKVVKNSQKQVINAYEKSIREKEKLLVSITDSLKEVRMKFGVFNTQSQAEVLAEIVSQTEAQLIRQTERLRVLKETPGIHRDTIKLLQADVKGLEKEYASITTDQGGAKFNIVNFNEGKEKLDYWTQIHQQTYRQLSYDKIRLDQIKTAYESDMTTVHLVEKAEVPIVKSRPKRSILVLGSVFVGLLLAMLYVLVRQSVEDMNQEA